jgi:hypothetical protein
MAHANSKLPNELGQYKCSNCEQWLDTSCYSKDKSQSTGISYQCKKCNKQKVRKSNIKTKYGITEEQFLRMLEEQDHKCAICEKDLIVDIMENSYETRPNIDHCHTTGKIRGMLCTQCNTGLGKFYDNPELLAKAIEYLNK